MLQDGIGLRVLRGGEALGGGTLGAVPAALADEEGARRDARVHFAAGHIDEIRLHVQDGAGPALVVHAEHLGPGLELPAVRRRGELLEKFHLALAVDGARMVELGDAGDLVCLGGGVEVDDILVGALEACCGSISP